MYTSIENIINVIILFLENRLVKACSTQTLFRNVFRSFLSSIPHLHYRRKDIDPIRGFSAPETCKQRRSDSCSPIELDPASHIKYQVLLNYSASDRGFKRFAYRLYQALNKRLITPCENNESFVHKVDITLARA